MRLVLVRHGQTHANVAGALDTGDPGEDLTDLGRRQAEELAGRLSGREIGAMFVSPLVRTHQTAAPLAASVGATPQEVWGFREIIAGDLEMRTDLESVMLYHEVASAWAHGQTARRMPGGETGTEVFRRFTDAAESARTAVGEDGTAVVVAHGAIIRTWAGWVARNVTPHYAVSRIVPNTGIVELEADRHGWTVTEWTGEPLDRSRP